MKKKVKKTKKTKKTKTKKRKVTKRKRATPKAKSTTTIMDSPTSQNSTQEESSPEPGLVIDKEAPLTETVIGEPRTESESDAENGAREVEDEQDAEKHFVGEE